MSLSGAAGHSEFFVFPVRLWPWFCSRISAVTIYLKIQHVSGPGPVNLFETRQILRRCQTKGLQDATT
jgi:hypothetical protein